MRIRDEDGALRLAAAIVNQARKDLRGQGPVERENSREFFHGDLFTTICEACDRKAEDARKALGV